MLYVGYLIIVNGQNIKKIGFENSIAFGNSTSQRIYLEHRSPNGGEKHINTA